MSIDLGQLLASVGPLASSAVNTSGTTVQITRDSGGRTFDRATGTYTASTAPTTVYEGPAIVAVPTPRPQPFGPGRVADQPRVPVFLLAEALGIQEEDLLTVTACRDAHMVGWEAKVREVGGDSTGLLRRLDVEATPGQVLP